MWTQDSQVGNNLMYQSCEVQQLVNPNQTTQSKPKANAKQKEKVIS